MRVRKASKALEDDTTLTRFIKIDVPAERKPKQLWMGDLQNKAFEEGRSIFHNKGVKQTHQVTNVLVSGHNNVKIGRDVRKGLYRGYWIYTLSLEERTTCPRSCHHWRSCYGNNMPFANRIDHTDPLFFGRLEMETAKLCGKKKGVLLRLHALGDFFSTEYVYFWMRMLNQYPNLAIYGYTAHAPNSMIGQIILVGQRAFEKRFSIRWSNGGLPERCTVSIEFPEQKPADAFQCPEQTGKTSCCATCGACWSTNKNVSFIGH